MAAITGFAKLNGGLREVLVARDFGTSRSLEAFLVAFALVSIGIDALAGGLPSALIPTIHRYDGAAPRRPAQVLGAVIPSLAVGCVALSALVALAAPLLALVVAGGFDGSGRQTVARVIVVLAPTIGFGVATAVATSCLQARDRFALAALPSIANPVATVLVVLIASRPTAATLAWAFAAGYGAELVAAIGVAASHGVRLARPDRAQCGADRRLFFSQLMPVSVGLLVLSGMTLSDQAVVAHFGRGQVAVLTFGIRIPGFVAAVGMTAVGAVMLPHFARAVGERRWDDLRTSLRSKVRRIVVIGVLLSAGLAIAARPMIDLVFAHGRFRGDDAAAAASVQVIAAWQVPFQLVSVVSARLLSARHRGRLILVVSIVAAVLNLVLDVVLGHLWGVRGVALGTTVVLGAMALSFSRLAWTSLPATPSRPEPVG